MDNTAISYDELMRELDRYRSCSSTLTKQQIDFIIKCRMEARKVPYEKMCELWSKVGWGNISYGTMRKNAINVLRENGKR
jgi:hypothetical protein